MSALCSLADCDRPSRSRGLCKLHYGRLLKTGRTYLIPRSGRVSDEARFWAKVQKTETCWEWIAADDGWGYGNFYYPSHPGSPYQRAHRVAYEWLVGPIPDGLVLDHLCRNRRCVNPSHLEPVTNAENLRRGREFELLCRNKHPYGRREDGSRYCPTCDANRLEKKRLDGRLRRKRLREQLSCAS